MQGRIWLKAIRPQFFTATLIPVFLGGILGWYETGNFNLIFFLLSLIGGIFIHAGLNLANDYFDHTSGVDDLNPFPTPFSGGSRVIQEGLLSPREILRASILFFLGGVGIGLYLNAILPGNTLLWIGILGVFLAFFYTGEPLRIGYTGLGEFSVFLGFGPVMVMGSYFVQAKTLSILPLLASIPVGILIALVLYINEFPDFEADKEGGKRTLVVILGKRKAVNLYVCFLGFVYLWIIGGIIFGFFPPLTLLTLLTLPLAFSAIRVARKNYNRIKELLPANALTILLHLTLGIILSLSYLLTGLFK